MYVWVGLGWVSISVVCAGGVLAMLSGGFCACFGDLHMDLVSGILIRFCVIALCVMLFGVFCVFFVWVRGGSTEWGWHVGFRFEVARYLCMVNVAAEAWLWLV